MSTEALLPVPPPLAEPNPAPIEDILPKVELIWSDGEPMESDWHVKAMNVLLASVDEHFHDRTDYYVGGNMFLYYSERQARNRDFRGPDFFFVWNTTRQPIRLFWALWLEDGRAPNVVIELISPTTAVEDRGRKKRIYETILHVNDYFCYDPDTKTLEGWRIRDGKYEVLRANEKGWLWSQELGLWVGIWHGKVGPFDDTWLRFYDRDGKLVPLPVEAARLRAEEAHRRVEAAEAELAALRQRLASLEKAVPPTDNDGDGLK